MNNTSRRTKTSLAVMLSLGLASCDFAKSDPKEDYRIYMNWVDSHSRGYTPKDSQKIDSKASESVGRPYSSEQKR